MQNKILLVEDNTDFQQLIKASIGFKYEVEMASSLDQARKKIQTTDYDLILMDVTLPDGISFDLVRELSHDLENKQIPVIFLTGRTEIGDKMIGFSLGAYDYLTKPLDLVELLLRIDSHLLRNQKRRSSLENIKKGPLRFEVINFSLFLQNNDGSESRAEVTPLEFKILLKLAQNSNKVLSRQQLLDGVWGNNVFIEDRCIDKHICAIRKKVSPYGDHIKTISGVGYEFKV